MNFNLFLQVNPYLKRSNKNKKKKTVHNAYKKI